MSDDIGSTAEGDLEIRSGGIVVVDTATLRSVAAGLLTAAAECGDVREILERARWALGESGVWIFPPGGAAADAQDRCRRLAADLHTMADTYEAAELLAAAAAADAGGDAGLARTIRSRAHAIVAADPAIALRLAAATVAWRIETAAALGDQYRAPGSIGASSPWGADALASLGVGAVGLLGLGALPAGSRLTGPSASTHVRRLGGGRTTAPTSLTQIVDRIPRGEGRVRVERYTMDGGRRRFVVYAAGTAPGGPAEEAWDARSNIELYTRTRSASFDATMAAAAEAGARSGDRVILVGYSQGAMVTSFVALSGEFDVPLLITFGDPVEAAVDPGTLSVAVRHLDDPISALAGGGLDTGTGAAGSFVASRASPGTAFDGDGMWGQHGLDAYRDTARLLDASGDPRMDAVRARWGELARARSVEAFVYGAARGTAPGRASGGATSGDAG